MLLIRKLEAYLKSLSSILTVAALFGLSACGGGGGGPGNGGGAGNTGGGNQLPTVKLNDSAQIIEYHGDSTVWGWQTNSEAVRVDTPAPAAFAAELPAFHTVRNLGVSGSTACDLLNGGANSGYALPWSQHMAASDATVVIINHAINDAVHERRSYSPAEYRDCLNQLVDIARDEGKVVILETPNPIDDEATLGTFVAEMRAVATQKGVNVIDQYAHLQQQPWADMVITPDGLHPTQDIYMEKGRFAAERFRTFDVPAVR